MQNLAITIFLVWATIIAAVFFYVARSGRSPDELSPKAYKRTRLFFLAGLLTTAVFCSVLSLPDTPYPEDGVVPDRVIYASGKQFAFKLSDKPISHEDAMDDEVFLSIKPIHTGDLVEFQVTGADVTHGFSIYDLAGHVQTQTQAMPQYVNRLRHRFPESGVYHVLCFELCGFGHPTMRAQLQVEDDPTAAKSAVASN